jgi:hypothetical protein
MGLETLGTTDTAILVLLVIVIALSGLATVATWFAGRRGPSCAEDGNCGTADTGRR